MTRPIPVQLKRTRGWRMPPNTVNVARPNKWGNPFRIFYHEHGICPGWYVQRQNGVITWGPYKTKRIAEDVALSKFERWARRHVSEIRADLAGANCACWCPLPSPGQPDRCHRATLLALANDRKVRP